MYEVTEDWSPLRRQRAADRIAQLAHRQRIITASAHPAALAASCDPDYAVTPAIELVSRNIERALRSRRRRLMITAPPQEFKSRLCAVWTPIRALQLHPDWRVMLLTYADGLAEEHSAAARSLIQQYGSGVVDSLTGAPLPDMLGLSLSADKSSVGNWRIQEGDGGLVAAGRDATITGRRADLLIVDDPFKNMQEADSAAIRAKVLDWYRSVATTRLAPGASVILIQCMTGDTPVMRPDGTETPLADIRPGDEIATYENGVLSTSTVMNWASQGYDDVLCIRAMSGRTVRANARHPFLTSEGVWKRAGQLTSGDRLVGLNAEPTLIDSGAERTISTDTVVSVEPAGRAEVFDIQVDRTENFIANGLVSHNTRWHPEDLAGHLLTADRDLDPAVREWRYLNIPAIAHPAIPDALGRAPGEPLVSARGRTLADWKATERNVGKRIWNALYQGSPVPPEGGLFSQEWFDAHRIDALPERTMARIVAIDPSESGEGDEAGVVAAALLYPQPDWDSAVKGPQPEVALFADRSAPMTSAQWAEVGVQLALDTQASDIYVETYTAGTTYLSVVRTHIRARIEAEKKRGAAADRALIRALTGLYNRVRPWRGTGDAVARSGLMRQAVEVGSCVMVGETMAEMESRARLWQAGQHQPDRLAASVIAHDRLVAMKGRAAQVGNPARSASGAGPNAAWLARRVG